MYVFGRSLNSPNLTFVYSIECLGCFRVIGTNFEVGGRGHHKNSGLQSNPWAETTSFGDRWCCSQDHLKKQTCITAVIPHDFPIYRESSSPQDSQTAKYSLPRSPAY
ncbi:hypothetical protein TNCV_2722741 [Trichonephila clavipes]|nr:hypothetical protein TNCV_2722741 [Trichonephila clavipes]